MKKVIAKIDFTMQGKSYIAGDEVETKDINVIRILNENGFIEPLDYKDLVILERNIKEEQNG